MGRLISMGELLPDRGAWRVLAWLWTAHDTLNRGASGQRHIFVHQILKKCSNSRLSRPRFNRAYFKSLPLMLSILPRWLQCSTSAVKMTISVSVLLTSAALIIARSIHNCSPCRLFFTPFTINHLKPETRLSLTMWSETLYPSVKLGLILPSSPSEYVKLIHQHP